MCKCSTYLNLVVGVLFEVSYERYTKNLKYSHKSKWTYLEFASEEMELIMLVTAFRNWTTVIRSRSWCLWLLIKLETRGPLKLSLALVDVCWLRVCVWNSICEDIFEIAILGHILGIKTIDDRLSKVNSSDPFLSVSIYFVFCFSLNTKLWITSLKTGGMLVTF